MRMITMGAVSAALTLIASSAFSATVTIENVTGSWTASTPSDVYGLGVDNGEASSTISWGKAARRGRQSGYRFDSAVPPSVDLTPGSEFELGVFSHINRPIYTMPEGGQAGKIESAELTVDFSVRINDSLYDVSRTYGFTHYETPNGGDEIGACQFGGTSGAAGINSRGCADRVELEGQGGDEVFSVDGLDIIFEIAGFQVDGEITDFFMTKERAINEAVLIASYRLFDDGGQIPSPVPLPAAGWMLIAGVGGLAAMKRRKRRNDA